MAKVNFNAIGTQITDELQSNVGANEFELGHGIFLLSSFLCSRLAAGAQPLSYGTDYILTTINERLRTEAGITTYQKVKILNVAYQTGNLYFTYKAVGDFIEAEDWSNADTVDSLHANDSAISNNDTTLSTKNKVKAYVDAAVATTIPKATNVTAIDGTGIANNEIAIFDLDNKKIKTSDKVFSTDGTLAGNSDSNIPTEKAVKTYADLKLLKSQNLDDLADKATARTNLDVYTKAETQGAGGSAGTYYYRKLPSGLIIQWGTTAADTTTITFPVEFSDTNYGFSGSFHNDYPVSITTKNVGSVVVPGKYSMQIISWMAIGY